MNILILANHLNPGGISAYCLLLCRIFHKSPHRILMASGGGAWVKRLSQWDVEHVEVPMNTSSEFNPVLIKAYAQLKEYILKKDIQVIHSQTRVGQVLAARLSVSCHVKRVFTCHGFFKTRLFRKMLPLWGDAIISISQPVTQHLKEDWRVRSEKVHPVPHGIDQIAKTEGCAEKRKQFRLQCNFADEHIVVGAFGRLSPVKGYDVLIHALHQVKEANIRLCLVGRGGEERVLRELAVVLGVNDKIRWIDEASEEHDFLYGFDIFCAPSRQEGLGLAIMEAMARGLPVVASAVGGIRVLIKHRESGLLVEPENAQALAEALDGLARDKVSQQAYAASAKNHLSHHHSMETMYSLTKEIYETLD